MNRLYLKKRILSLIKRVLKKFKLNYFDTPGIFKIAPGDFDRPGPFSTVFGFDRGGAIDRYYIENFLQKESRHIKGRVLEIGDNSYSLLYGANKITQSDILHVDESNSKATFFGDLSRAPHIPDNAFDCIILTQTLHLIYYFKEALETCHRILKPGGVLLLTSPGITPIDHGEWEKSWYWSFTDKSLSRLVTDTFAAGNYEVETFGNVYVATAFLYGMGIPEVTKERMDHRDPHFQVTITVKAVKNGHAEGTV